MNFTLKFDSTLTLADDKVAVSAQEGLNNPGLPGPPSTPKPLVSQLDAGGLSHVLSRVPFSASMEKPGTRQAGKWSASFDFKDMPIDPRTVAAAWVEIHIGTVDPGDFAKGMAGRETTGARLSTLRTIGRDGSPNSETLRMVGFVDEWIVRHTGESSVVEMNGRDMRGALLDRAIGTDPAEANQLIDKLDLSRPINEVVLQIIRFEQSFANYSVIANAGEWPNGVIPAPGGLETVPRHRKGAKGKRSSGRGTPPSATSSALGGAVKVWDLVVRFCYLVGAVPYVDNFGRIVIRPAKDIYGTLAKPVDPVNNPTPFAHGSERAVDLTTGVAITPALKIRRLVYGRDVVNLDFQRKFGGETKPKIVRTFCWDPDSGKKGGTMVYGLYPPQLEKPRATKPAPGKGAPEEEIVNYRVSGVTNPASLAAIAESIFNQLGRAEMGGSVTTNNLSSFGGDNTDPDLLGLAPGDGVELLVDTRSVHSGAPLVSTLTDHHRDSFTEAVASVKQLLGDEQLARVIVATARGQVNELQRFFLVTNVKFGWGDDGIKIDFDFTNYVVARWDDNAGVVPPTQLFDFTGEEHVITGAGNLRHSSSRRRTPVPAPTDVQVVTFADTHVIVARSPLRQK